MRKGLFIILIIALLTAITPATAQGEDIPSCTEEELAPTLEAVSTLATDYLANTKAIASSEYAEADAVINYGAKSGIFWYEEYPTLSDCLESRLIGHDYALVVDEAIIEHAFAQMAAFEQAYGDPAIAQAYLDFNESRVERNQALIANTMAVFDETGEIVVPTDRLPSCTPEDDASQVVSDMIALITAYQETRNAFDSTTVEGLTSLVSGYAGISNIHWLEIYPQLPVCYEINKFAKSVGLIYEQTLISVLMLRLSVYEAEFGYPENATWMDTAAAVRQEILTMLFTEAFPPAAQ